MKNLKKINSKFMKQLKELLDSDMIKLIDLLNKKNNFRFPAVYVFSKPNSKEVIYAGRTTKLHLWERIKHHKRLKAGADLNVMIKNKPNFPQNIDDYGVRCLRVDDNRKRMFFENFVISILQPELNKEGNFLFKK